MLKYFTILVFNLLGWKVEGNLPPGTNKCVMVGAPHTSNLDYILGMATFYKLNLPIRYLIKQDWVKTPILGSIMKNSGAIGVNRTEKSKLVDTVVHLLQTHDPIALMVTPEGTRKLTRQWKTGFYYAALRANVPIVLSSLDYKRKRTTIGPGFMPSGDFHKDMEIVRAFYQDKTPKYPENFSLEICPPAEETKVS